MALKKSDVEVMAESIMKRLITGEAQHALFSIDGGERQTFRICLSEAIYEELKEKGIAE